MVRSKSTTGFNSRAVPVASRCLANTVAASLVLAGVVLCLCVGLTLVSSAASFAMPLTH